VRYLDLTLPTPAENLALDEALLEEAESAGRPTETLRIWEPGEPMVVVGRSSQVGVEVRLKRCRKLGIPVLRRTSGGAAILTGPGCLMYGVVLGFESRPMLRAIDHAHRFVLGKVASALEPLVPGVRCRGTSDLAVGERKFSGNSIRVKRDHLLYHGTLLYDFPLGLVDECLAMPPREPDYRQGRGHESFVANLPLPPAAIRQALVAVWKATEPFGNWPHERTGQLVVERYARSEWNERR
jgi:lipoate-protein ligase A